MTPALVVFLGNPGREYALTRHNYPWMLADRLAVLQPWTAKFKGEWTSQLISGVKVPLLKPQTFMNLSGESVRACLDFFKLESSAVLAVHDDLELGLGQTKGQKGGGLGGHNGLKSLEKHLGTRDFYRLRLGIGRPVHGTPGDFVLGRFTAEEEITVRQTLEGLVRDWDKLLAALK